MVSETRGVHAGEVDFECGVFAVLGDFFFEEGEGFFGEFLRCGRGGCVRL